MWTVVTHQFCGGHGTEVLVPDVLDARLAGLVLDEVDTGGLFSEEQWGPVAIGGPRHPEHFEGDTGVVVPTFVQHPDGLLLV